MQQENQTDFIEKLMALIETADKTQNLNTEKLKANKLVLYFYPKDMTPGCSLEAQEFNQLYPQFQQNGIEVIGISLDNLTRHNKFCQKFDLQFPLLSDEDHKICDLFGVYKLKKLYGKEFYGIERSSFFIENNQIKNKWLKVKAKGHAAEVLEFINQTNK